jgi:truncated hemoglobin YjbI
MLLWRGAIMVSTSERSNDDAVVERVVADFITRVRADHMLAPLLEASRLEELRQLSSEFLVAELRGQSTLTPWTNVSAALLGLGLGDPEYRATLSHFIVALFSSNLAPTLAARLAARIEWSVDCRRGGGRRVGA